MALSSASGRISGRTTPLSEEMSDDAQDIFDRNPAYQHKVPPSPVVHRRSSTDWVNFDAHDDDGGGWLAFEKKKYFLNGFFNNISLHRPTLLRIKYRTHAIVVSLVVTRFDD